MTPRGFKKNFSKTDGYKQTTLISYFSSQKFSNRKITSDGEKNTNLFTIPSKDMNELSTISIDSGRVSVTALKKELARKIHRYPVKSKRFSQSQAIVNESGSAENIQQYTPKLHTPIVTFKMTVEEYNKPEKNNLNSTGQASKTPKKSTSAPVTPKKLKLSPKKERFSPGQKSSVENEGMINTLKKIVDGVLAQSNFRALLAANEERQIKIFLNMNKHYQFFLCKLMTRKHIWYNVFKLVEDLKMDIIGSEIIKMYEELKKADYVKTDYSAEDSSSLLANMLKHEVIDICKKFRVTYKDLPKQDLINKLLSTVHCQQPVFPTIKSVDQLLKENIKDNLGLCVKLNENFHNLLYKFYVLYFLTDFSPTMSIADWNYLIFQIEQGDTIYPEFKVEDDVSIFASKDEFEEYVHSYAHYQSALTANSKKQKALLMDLCKTAAKEVNKLLERNSGTSNGTRFSAGYMYAHTISSNIEFLLCKYPEDTYELLKCLLGQTLYKQSKRGFWYEKLAWIQWKYFKQYKQAVETLTMGLKDVTINEVAKHDLSQVGRKFKKLKSVKLPASVYDEICLNIIDPPDHVPFKEVVINAVTDRENESGRKRKYIVKNDDGERAYLTVEDVACHHYHKEGFRNITKCEGKFLVSLYRLSFWDIIYDSSIKGVFISKLQKYPLDFYSKQFYENRKQKIDQRLEDIETNWTKNQFKEFLNTICQHDRLAQKLSEFVEDPMQLCEIVWCIGRQQFAKICKRFIDEFYLFNSGLPDLFMWSVESKKAKFVEVKGEGDRLSTKQMLWLDFFRSIEVDAEVCYVHSTGSRGGRKYKKKCFSPDPEEDNE